MYFRHLKKYKIIPFSVRTNRLEAESPCEGSEIIKYWEMDLCIVGLALDLMTTEKKKKIRNTAWLNRIHTYKPISAYEHLSQAVCLWLVSRWTEECQRKSRENRWVAKTSTQWGRQDVFLLSVSISHPLRFILWPQQGSPPLDREQLEWMNNIISSNDKIMIVESIVCKIILQVHWQ